MTPEISHRCPSCGASARTGAKYCPQCGVAFNKPALDVTAKLDSSEIERKEAAKRGSTAKTMPFKPELRSLPFGVSPLAEKQIQASDDSHAKHLPSVEEPEARLSTRNRVKEAARGVVEENVRPRVEKLRHASSIVLEEAAIDPSFRFVLIALVIFIVFIVLLVFSFIR